MLLTIFDVHIVSCSGDDNCRPLVELANNRWRCKIAAGNDVECLKATEPNGAAPEAVQVNSDKSNNGEIQSVAETEDQICSIKIEQALIDEIVTTANDDHKLRCNRHIKPSMKKRFEKSGKTEPLSDLPPQDQKVEALEETSIAVSNPEEMLLSDQLSSTNRPRHKTKKF